ncbi:MAG: helix-turn-helix transcriptional regulator [Methanosarcinales archaeon]
MKKYFIAFLLIVLCITIVPSQEFSNDTFYSNQVILNIYINESGRSLITGYVENLTLANLQFLNSEYIFDKDTNQLYAVTDSLTWKYADVWKINLTLIAYYSEFNIVFYFPKNTIITKINRSSGLTNIITTKDGILSVEFYGFNTVDPAILINYKQSAEDLKVLNTTLSEENTPKDNNNFIKPFVALIIFILLILFVILYIIRKTREKSLEKSIDRNPRATKIPEIPFKDKKEIDTNKIEVTSEMKKVMETLSDRERAIVDLLIKENGSLLQSKIRYETEIPKASLTGIIYSLERKKIIKKKKYGKTNKIELSEWFLSKNKED